MKVYIPKGLHDLLERIAAGEPNPSMSAEQAQAWLRIVIVNEPLPIARENP